MASLEQTIKGMQIFAKYKGAGAYALQAEHDMLYGPEAGENIENDDDGNVVSFEPPYDDDMKKMTDADRKKLKELSWFMDSESGHWAIFT